MGQMVFHICFWMSIIFCNNRIYYLLSNIIYKRTEIDFTYLYNIEHFVNISIVHIL
ncbi:hypothetical protein SAMN04488087_0183 [Rhodothermus profundi]|uniref:Uncharacterized protein n=1 Tax=Rhodothermus profundi TaxID=633813 RepID=A0A1M6PH83_9BACT|nr:hypothetical protein SAMN04488087_0183 [Rhodothermus profundi]